MQPDPEARGKRVRPRLAYPVEVKRLYLLRHAKSSWKEPGLADRDRPLARRGRRAARAMGRHLAASGLQPDLVLCSPARRTVETLDRVRPHLCAVGEARLAPGLYGASAEGIVDLLRSVSNAVDDLLVVGHEPALSELAALVAIRDESSAWERLRQKFPTGACAEIHLSVTEWRSLAPGCGRLERFSTPRDLE
jgi:phosphohistidine phosphatase